MKMSVFQRLFIYITIIIFSTQSYNEASSQEFSIPDNGKLCKITGRTSEELTLLRLLNASIDHNMVEIIGTYVPCELIQDILKGKEKYFYPLITLQVTKTDGKILPFLSINDGNLREKVAKEIESKQWSDQQKREAEEFNKIIGERGSGVEFKFSSTSPSIVDYSDKTVSVAQVSTINVGDGDHIVTAISTSTLVDGYLVSVTITDRIETAKDFWRAQFITESLVRGVEVKDGKAHPAPSSAPIYEAPSQWLRDRVGQREGYLYVTAEGGGVDQSGQRLSLTIRCKDDVTSVIMSLRSDLTIPSNSRVQSVVSVDGASRGEVWIPSTDGKYVGKWTGDSSIPFIKSLLLKNRLSISIPLKNQADDRYFFSISGIEREVGEIRSMCRW